MIFPLHEHTQRRSSGKWGTPFRPFDAQGKCMDADGCENGACAELVFF